MGGACGSPLLELSKGCSGGIWWFSFLMSVESFLVVVWSFFLLGGGRNLGTGFKGHISIHAFHVIEFWPAQTLLELVSVAFQLHMLESWMFHVRV